MLTAHQLSCVRGDRLLFKEVSLTLDAGGLMYVLGENGSGKSSLLRMLCGFLRPEAGVVYWNKKAIQHHAESYLSQLSYIGHLNGLKDDLTALENLLLGARVAGRQVSKYGALSALKAMGVERCADLPAGVLSQGQKRRVTLACLWLAAGQLWILDEPFAALDATSIFTLAKKIEEHLSQGGMAILTSHQEVEIHALSSQTLRLSQ